METFERKLPISVCIPTKDRPEELKRCIESVLEQTVLPAEIIIIDDGNLDQLVYKQIIEPHARFIYFKKDKPSTAASRNLAKSLTSNNLILMLDDDTALDKEFIKNISKIFNKDINKEIGIVGGIIVNRKRKSWFDMLYRRLFLLDNGNPGRLLPWGFQTGFNGLVQDIIVDWVSTCAACFRRDVLEEFFFEELEGGRNALEDVEFSWKVFKSKKYKMIVTPAARLYHYHSSTHREAMFNTGFKQAFKRCWIFKKYCDRTLKNTMLFGWAMTGHILGMIGTGRLKTALGNIGGIISFLKERLKTENYSAKNWNR
jgi:GT2 family glycosyltransferase